jgi:DNA-binding ferritin-like protein (Dps family)
MTKQSRALMYGSIFISGLVILTTLLLIISASRNNRGINGAVIAGILILAVVAVGIMFLARKQIMYRAKLLNSEFFEEYERVCDMLQGSVLGHLEKKETLKDILGLFIDAQNSGRSVEQVTGGNTEDFVARVQASFGYRSKYIFMLLTGTRYSIIYLFMVQIYEWIKHGDTFFDAQPGYTMIILLLPVALIGVPLMRQLIWKQRIFWAFIVPIGFVALGVAFMEITWANFMHIGWISAIHEDTFSYVPGWWFLSLWIGIFALTFGIQWLIRKNSIRKL